MALERPTRLEKHGHVRVDDYYWMKERDDPEVIAYLEAENARTAAAMAHNDALVESLYAEITGRIVPDDWTVPSRRGDWFYNVRYVPDGEYPLYCRRRGSAEAPEEIMLDANVLARGHTFFAARVAANLEGSVAAYATDTVGRNFFTIRFQDLESGQTLPDTIPDVTPNMVWAADGRTLFYAARDPQTLRTHRIYRHALGTDAEKDVLVYEESDETFSCYVTQTKSRRYLMIHCSHTVSDEVRWLEANEPEGEFRVFEPRSRGHEYSVDHCGDRFYVRTNHEAQNFRLMSAPLDRTDRASWRDVVPHRPDVLLGGFELFNRYLVTSEREAGLVHLRVRTPDGAQLHEIAFDEPTYAAGLGGNAEVDTQTLRFHYTSLTTPGSVYDYDLDTREQVLRKRQEVPGGFDPAAYVTERLEAPAADGVRVPISLVYRRDKKRPGGNPLLLYAYGSYGASMDAAFSPARLSLIDRGFVFAIAHVRGGQELGRQWYEDGKLLSKRNTFTDFIACAEHLVAQGYTRREQLFGMGGSAGGLLMGAVINLAPGLFHGIVAAVPFVDAVTTMLDSSIPLTTSEYDEWGDPNQKESYEYMLSYSPYDNVARQDYPHLLVTTGLHDSQVQYWEPAKWVAKLRAHKTDANRLLLKTNMEAGHGGASGRFAQHRETAFEYAFLLDLAGVDE